MRMQWRETLYQVGIAVKEVFGVGSMHTSFFSSHQQFIFCQQIKKRISANDYIFFNKERFQHYQQLATSAPWLLFADEQHLLNDNFSFINCSKLQLLMFIKSLS